MTLYIDSVRDALDRCLALDSRVQIIGEDILDPYGGAFKATKGLSTKYPGRLHTTPISESAIVGLTTGMALRGLRPVAEIMFGDFMTLCVDQIVNSASKFPLMYGEKVSVPAVVRTPVGGARGYGPTHSQSLEKLFFGVPGLDVVAPSRLHDPGKLLEHVVLTSTIPTLFVEDKGDYPHHLFPDAFPHLLVSEVEADDSLPTVVAKNFDEGNGPDVAIIGYGGAASLSAAVLDELANEEIYGILIAPARVNDIEALDKVVEQVPRNVPVLIAEQGTFGFGWASEVMARMLERGMSSSKVVRLAAKPVAIPAARHLEADVILNEGAIKNAIFEVLS